MNDSWFGLARSFAVGSIALVSTASHAQSVLSKPTTEQRRVASAIEDFQRTWNAAWKASEEKRHGFTVATSYDAFPSVHCHLQSTARSHLAESDPVIRSERSFFAVCPSYLNSADVATDERYGIDNALDEGLREGVRAARARLIRFLDSAVARSRSDDFAAGQMVRFLLDQGEIERAIASARTCAASQWWCAAIGGLALARSTQLRAADSAFTRSVSLQSRPGVCAWSDIRALLELNARRQYEKVGCAQRDSLNASIFWLSDPLLSEPGNERRVEHFVRKTMLALRAPLENDERFDWRIRVGGDARAELVERYGWPSFVYWPGPKLDAEHTGWLGSPKQAFGPPNEPYTTYEYSRARLHLVPNWNTLRDPFSASASDMEAGRPPPSLVDQLDAKNKWWPVEHFAPPFEVFNLPPGQTAFLRRDTAILVAAAIRLHPATLPAPTGSTLSDVRLVVSDAPDSAKILRVLKAQVGSTIVLNGLTQSRPALLGIETLQRADRTTWAARMRVGVKPPATLASMKAGDVAMSDPIVLTATGDAELPSSPDSAIQYMAGELRFDRTQRIGVYWETYGVGPGDSAQVTIWVERHTNQGILRNIAINMNLTEDLNTPVVVTWREPRLGARQYSAIGRIPIMGRSVALDISNLVPGEYWLDVAVRKYGANPVRSRRSFEIIR